MATLDTRNVPVNERLYERASAPSGTPQPPAEGRGARLPPVPYFNKENTSRPSFEENG